MPRKQNLQPLLDVRQNHLGLVFGAGDALDAKALGILGFSAAALTFGLGAALQNPWWLWGLMLVNFIVSITVAIMVIWTRDYSGASVDITQHSEYLAMPEDQLILQLLADTQTSIEKNESLNKSKAHLCAIAILFAVIGLETLLACIIKV